MRQPYPLPIGGKLDFSFDATELVAAGDSIASYTLDESANVSVSGDATANGYVTFYAEWAATPEVGEMGSVSTLITSTAGRILPKTMSFFAVESL